MDAYRVFCSSHHGGAVCRMQMKDVNDIPDFNELGIYSPFDYTKDMVEDIDFSNTEDCLMQDNLIWFEDRKGVVVAEFDLDPDTRNGVRYIDDGPVFDEKSTSEKPYFYFFQVLDKICMNYLGIIETDGPITADNICAKTRSVVDADGNELVLIDPSTIMYGGEQLKYWTNMDDDGTDGEYFWTLQNGVRKKASRPKMPLEVDED